MWEFLKDLVKPLIESIRKPVLEWILSLSWWKRVVILILIVAAFVSFRYYKEVKNSAALGIRMARVVLARGERFPLRQADRERLKNSVERLSSILKTSLSGTEFAGQAWTTAQILIALEGRATVDAKSVQAYFESQMKPDCSCWQKYPDVKYPAHIAVSATVLFSLARLRQPVTTDQLLFLLENQNIEGWWPIYPNGKDGSTYATALSVLALHEQHHMGLVSAKDSGRVKASVERGLAWLLSTQVQGKARWRDYRLGRESLSISGLALHVLHRTGQAGLSDVDRLWLQTLPSPIPSAIDPEASYITIFDQLGKPIHTDDTRYYPLQWAIVATVDAYPNGTIRERAAALGWIENALKFPGPLDKVSGTKEDDWIAAELVTALRYLAGEKFFSNVV